MPVYSDLLDTYIQKHVPEESRDLAKTDLENLFTQVFQAMFSRTMGMTVASVQSGSAPEPISVGHTYTLEQVMMMKVPQLREILTRLGLSVTGQKNILQNRLLEYQKGQVESGSLAAQTSGTKPLSEYTVEQIHALHIRDIRPLLVEQGLKVDGVRDHLIQRALRFLEGKNLDTDYQSISVSKKTKKAGLPKCKGITGKGLPCSFTVAEEGAEYCFQHNPEHHRARKPKSSGGPTHPEEPEESFIELEQEIEVVLPNSPVKEPEVSPEPEPEPEKKLKKARRKIKAAV